MKAAAALSAALLVPAAVLAQNSSAASGYLTSVLGALQAANLTSLVGVASAIANTTEGMALLGELATGNKTVFAPSNDAFANVSSDVSSNTTLLTEILSYHILNGSYTVNNTMTAPNHTIARTLLQGGMYKLPGNVSAPLVLAKNASTATSFQIVQAYDNVSTVGPAQAANLDVYIIDEVLTLPPSIGDVAENLFPSLAGVINQTGLLAPLAEASGITVFAPNNDALNAIMADLGSLNSSQITTVLANHVINGSVVYSTELTSANYTSAAGEPFKFSSNSTGAYVTSANSTAMIVQSDIIISNGVVHIIDGVLVNTASNATAAAAAASSYAAGATSMANTATSAASTASGSGASSSKSAAMGAVELGLAKSLFSGAIALAGLVIGGGYILM